MPAGQSRLFRRTLQIQTYAYRAEYQRRVRQDKFEEIERQQFGKDGYEDAVAQIGQIEQALGLVDLAQFTAPPPPKA